jgi:hypothetical protein
MVRLAHRQHQYLHVYTLTNGSLGAHRWDMHLYPQLFISTNETHGKWAVLSSALDSDYRLDGVAIHENMPKDQRLAPNGLIILPRGVVTKSKYLLLPPIDYALDIV